jgi:hypothetical protein
MPLKASYLRPGCQWPTLCEQQVWRKVAAAMEHRVTSFVLCSACFCVAAAATFAPVGHPSCHPTNLLSISVLLCSSCPKVKFWLSIGHWKVGKSFTESPYRLALLFLAFAGQVPQRKPPSTNATATGCPLWPSCGQTSTELISPW